MKLRGRAHRLGANIDTDVIIPAEYLSISDPAELGKHCLEGIDPGFVRRVQPGDIIVAGTNFGCGSSREHAALAIKGCGISCIIAPSFARIFFRNAVRIGLPALETPEAEQVKEGDLLEVDLDTGNIININQGRVYQAVPYPPMMLEIIAAGGLVEYTRRRLASK